jgi:GT2 family glycosyltransferase
VTSKDTATRAHVRGKFLYAGGSKLYVRGVTYGTFGSDRDGNEFPPETTVDRDFRHMAASGVNAVRVYTTPPRWLLDRAASHGLRVMVGLAIERRIGQLVDGGNASDIEALVRSEVEQCAGHPAVLCYVLGNEIPAPIVRWLGRETVERLLHRLYLTAKRADPGIPVTYANYPSTEYLQLDFLDLVCFNVFLESRPAFEAYLTRLQNVAGDRPLVVSEMGLDSRSHSEADQAQNVAWQLRSAYAAGCAGTFVYAWTDEWHTSAGEVRDWDFGLVRRDRSEKPAVEAVRSIYSEVPYGRNREWPRVSVAVCTYNGARTLRDCLAGVGALVYPDFETIVVDDGSTDDTAAIAQGYPVRLIRTPQRGLGNARNTALDASTGEIVAYIDDDAWPDPQWLTYLVAAFAAGDHAAVGGPNIAPGGYGFISDCVAHAPGNATHVLLTDGEAEHLPGCNMAFRRSRLQAIGGFDARFRTAGDDVDIGWRLRDRGWTLGFAPGATVWHRRRATIHAYWKQQRGYGRAEALLEAKWPQRYTAAGLPMWIGRVYTKDLGPPFRGSARIYHGVWGTAPFQSIYTLGSDLLGAMPLLPEWYLLVLGLGVMTALGALWAPFLLAAPLLVGAIGASLVQAMRSASRATVGDPGAQPGTRLRMWALTSFLYLLQPAARLWGRLGSGLTPWRRRRPAGVANPLARHLRFWSERWQPQDTWVRSIEEPLREGGATVGSGGPFDRFDLEVRGGLLGAVRILVAVEEHGAGRQLVRIRYWPKWSLLLPALTGLTALLSIGAAVGSVWEPAILFATAAILLLLRAGDDAAGATAEIRRAIEQRVGHVATALVTPPNPG